LPKGVGELTFAVGDNLTGNMIKAGMRHRIRNVLKSIVDSGYETKVVVIIGTFDIVDKFGAKEESNVVSVIFTGESLARVNWNNFLPDDIYSIAETSWVHPIMKD